MEIEFTKRNQKGLHCRFCKTNLDFMYKTNLYETSPVKGIVCEDCMMHLTNYLDSYITNEKNKESDTK